MNISIEMKSNKIIPWLLRIVAAILFFGIVLFCLIQWGGDGFFLPSWIQWTEADQQVMIDGETVQMRRSKRTLSFADPSGTRLWKSEKGWKVSQVWISDIDHDGMDEVVFLVWKRGSFGDHRPFWIEENDDAWSQHIFFYDWDKERPDRLKPVWMSSALGIQAAQVSINDENHLLIVTPEGRETAWNWDSWGLVRLY